MSQTHPRPHPIRGVMALNRISVTYLAAAVGVSRNHLGKVVNGRAKSSEELRRRLAEVLGIPVERLFREPEPPAHRFPGDAVVASNLASLNAWRS